MIVLVRRMGYVLVLALLMVAVPAVAQAKYTKSVSASTAVSTDTLSAPTTASAAKQCSFLSYNAQVTWTAASDQYATGYVVTRTANGNTTTTTISGRTTTSATVAIGVGTSSTFTVTTTYQKWTSVPSAPTAAVQCGIFG